MPQDGDEAAEMEGVLEDILRNLESKALEDVGVAANAITALLVELVDEQGMGTLKRRKSLTNKRLEAFLRLQDSFAFNLCGRLASHLEQLVSSETAETPCIIAVFRAIEGLSLVHRPSRLVFDNKRLLTLLINSLNHANPDVQVRAVNTLVAVMVRQVEIIRRFEELKGLKVATDIFKSRHTPKQVKLAILEFLFFYLVPETKFVGLDRTIARKTTGDKQRLLGKYLSNVDGLVRELELSQPFGPLDLEW